LRRWVWEPQQALCLGLLLVAVLRRGWWCEKGGGLTLLGIGHGGLYEAVVEGVGNLVFSYLRLGLSDLTFAIAIVR